MQENLKKFYKNTIDKAPSLVYNEYANLPILQERNSLMSSVHIPSKEAMAARSWICEPEKTIPGLDFTVDTDQMLSLAIKISAVMLESGAEIHRVEDTLTRICRAYGAQEVQAFSIPSLVAATVTMPDGYHKTEIYRISSISYRYDVLENLNALSRRICNDPIPLHELANAVEEAMVPEHRPKRLIYLCSIIAAAGFALFFGGDWRDALAALPVGALICLLDMYKPAKLHALAFTVLVSVAAGLMCILTAAMGLACHMDKVMIGGIMLLIPGLAFGNSLRELLCGDIIAGSLRMIQALLTAVCIAAGFAVAVIIGGGWLM